MDETCMACGTPVTMMVQRGSGYCSQQCQEDDGKEWVEAFPISQEETCEDLRDVT